MNERKALFKGLMSALVMNGRIVTTEEKAKSIRSSADKLITKARKEKTLAKRLLERELFPTAIEKLLSDVAPRFHSRNGGYTRMIRIGRRFSDNAQEAVLEWVEGEAPKKAKPVAKKTPVKARSEKKVVKKPVRRTKNAKS